MKQARSSTRPLIVALLVALLLAVLLGWWLLRAQRDVAGQAGAVAPLERTTGFGPEPAHGVEGSFAAAETRAPVALNIARRAVPERSEPVGPYAEVQVVTAEGEPVRGAFVSCPGHPELSALTDDAGLARLQGDPFAGGARGEVRVKASSLCYRESTAPLERGAVWRVPSETSLIGTPASTAPTPTRLVLQRCAVLQLRLPDGGRASNGLTVHLHAAGRLYEQGLPRSATGSIVGGPGTACDPRELQPPASRDVDAAPRFASGDVEREGRPSVSAAIADAKAKAAENAARAREIEAAEAASATGAARASGEHSDKPYIDVFGDVDEVGGADKPPPEDASALHYALPGNGRMLVGLQPDQPIDVLVVGAYGEPVFRRTLTLAADEWLRLDVPALAATRDLIVLVHCRDAEAELTSRIAVRVDGAELAPFAAWDRRARFFAAHPSRCMPLTPGRRELQGLRAERVTLRVSADGYQPRELADVALQPGDNTLDVVLEPDAASPTR